MSQFEDDGWRFSDEQALLALRIKTSRIGNLIVIQRRNFIDRELYKLDRPINRFIRWFRDIPREEEVEKIIRKAEELYPLYYSRSGR